MQSLIASLLGPMLAKELVELSRRWRYYLARLVVGLGLLSVILFVWSQHRFLPTSNMSTVGVLALLGQMLFTGLAWLQYLAVYLLLPPMLCGVVAAEREANTLDVLLTTQLSNREIVLGKFGSRLLTAGLTIFAIVPVLLIVLSLGGVDLMNVLSVAASTLLTVLFVGAVSVYSSTVARTPLGALVRSYAYLAFWMGVVPFFVLLAMGSFIGWHDGPILNWVALALSLINPAVIFSAAMVEEIFELNFSAWGQAPNGTEIYFYALAYLLIGAWSIVLLIRSVWSLRQAPTNSRGQNRGQVRADKPRRRWIWIPPIHRVPIISVLLPNNPLAWRATTAPVYDREGHVARLQLFMAIGCVVLAAQVWISCVEWQYGPHVDRIWILAPVIGWPVAGLLTVAVASGSFASDRRRGFLDLLLATPLRRRELFDGTVAAVGQHVWLAYALLAGVAGLMGAGVMLLQAGARDPSFSLLGLALAWVIGAALGLYLAIACVACSVSARSWGQSLLAGMLLLAFEVLGVYWAFEFTYTDRVVAICILTPISVGLALTGARFLNYPVAVAFRILAFRWLLLMLALDPWGLAATVDPSGHFVHIRFEPGLYGWAGTYLIGLPAILAEPDEVMLFRSMYLGPLGMALLYLGVTLICAVAVRGWAIGRFNALVGRDAPARPQRRARAAEPS